MQQADPVNGRGRSNISDVGAYESLMGILTIDCHLLQSSYERFGVPIHKDLQESGQEVFVVRRWTTESGSDLVPDGLRV